jgi:hypothetical protein
MNTKITFTTAHRLSPPSAINGWTVLPTREALLPTHYRLADRFLGDLTGGLPASFFDTDFLVGFLAPVLTDFFAVFLPTFTSLLISDWWVNILI